MTTEDTIKNVKVDRLPKLVSDQTKSQVVNIVPSDKQKLRRINVNDLKQTKNNPN